MSFRSNLRWIGAIAVVTSIVTPSLANAQALAPYKSEAGKFTVLMPGKVQISKKGLPTAAGNIDLNIHAAQEGDSAYLVMYSDYPKDMLKKADPTKILDGARDGAVRSTQGKLISEKKIKIEGQPGREVEIEAQSKAYIKVRFFLKAERMYQIMVATKDKASLPKNTTQFQDSFKLVR